MESLTNSSGYVNGNSRSPDTPLLEAAFNCASRGWPVFPLHTVRDGQCSCSTPRCDRPGKHPKTRNGLHDATTDPDQIRTWWSQWPDANIGLRTGKESGLFVLDIDGSDGEEALVELEAKHGPLPETIQVITGRGRHLYFNRPGHRAIPNSAGKLGSKLDVRGDGGYVILPPSAHVSGKNYEWELSSHPDDIQVADAPQWLLDVATSNPTPKAESASPHKHPDLAHVFDGVPDGQRDDAVFRFACSRRARGLSKAEVSALVREAARNCDPPFPEEQALRKVEQAFKYPSPGQASEELANQTDMGNAQRMARRHGAQVRFCKTLGPLIYDGKRWTSDDLSQLQAFAKETVRSMLAEAAQVLDENRRKSLGSFALKCESAARIQAMLQLLPSEPNLSVTYDAFDPDKELLNVLNGTIDLRTGQIRPHSPADMITKLAPVIFDPQAQCDRWNSFILEIMNGEEELASFLQRLLGYSCTGITREQVWAFLWGQGENGKGTLIELISYILGDYFATTAPETFLESKNQGIRNDLAKLRGARFVAASEPPNRRFDPAVLKAFSGEDKIVGRFLYREEFEFQPEGKLFFSANHRPEVRDTSHAFWRRVLLIPFTRIFTGGDKDPRLREKLKAEAPGILNWLLRGCLEWQARGLQIPQAIQAAVADYRHETDILADFLESSCVIEPTRCVPVKDLYATYLGYCEAQRSKKSLSRQKFNEDLLGRPGLTRNQIGPTRTHMWFGIGLSVHAEAACRSCTDCDLNGQPCPKSHDNRDPKSCDYFVRYN